MKYRDWTIANIQTQPLGTPIGRLAFPGELAKNPKSLKLGRIDVRSGEKGGWTKKVLAFDLVL